MDLRKRSRQYSLFDMHCDGDGKLLGHFFGNFMLNTYSGEHDFRVNGSPFGNVEQALSVCK
jgi:hypothetical protein